MSPLPTAAASRLRPAFVLSDAAVTHSQTISGFLNWLHFFSSSTSSPTFCSRSLARTAKERRQKEEEKKGTQLAELHAKLAEWNIRGSAEFQKGYSAKSGPGGAVGTGLIIPRLTNEDFQQDSTRLDDLKVTPHDFSWCPCSSQQNDTIAYSRCGCAPSVLCPAKTAYSHWMRPDCGTVPDRRSSETGKVLRYIKSSYKTA